MAEVIPQINIDGTKIKDTWTEKEYVTDEVYNALNKTVIDLKNNNNLLDSNSILFREEYNSSSKNLNNAIHQGVYSFTNSAVNAPSGVNGGNLLVTNTSKTNQGSSIITQIAFCHNGAVYARTKNTSENFTSWNKLAYITDNVASATKATQDSQGQQINTTYVKGVTGSNATLTVTKGNGTTSTITVNNVAHATNSDSSTNTGNFNQGFQTNGEDFPASTFRKTILGRADSGICARPFCGKLPTNTDGSSSGIAFGGFDTHGFIQMAYGSPSVYVGAGNANKINWYKKLAITESPAFSGTPTAPTPSTGDNSTKIATTAFVRNLLGRAVGKTQPTLTALIDWETMKSANGGTDVRNIKNTSSGIIAYGGDSGALNKGDIILKQAFTNFDALLIRYTHDDGWWNKTVIIPIWEFNIMFNTKGFFQLLKEEGSQWQIRGNGYSDRPSTTTRLNVRDQNCGIIEIYGITY